MMKLIINEFSLKGGG